MARIPLSLANRTASNASSDRGTLSGSEWTWMSIAPRRSRATVDPVACGIAWRAGTTATAAAIRAAAAAILMGANPSTAPRIVGVGDLHNSDNARRTAGCPFVLHRANEHGRARGRNSAEIRHQLDAVLPCSENREVRNELADRARIQAQRVHANPRDIALVNEEPRRLVAEPGSVHHAIGVLIEKLLLA